jgi:hypothetical protein
MMYQTHSLLYQAHWPLFAFEFVNGTQSAVAVALLNAHLVWGVFSFGMLTLLLSSTLRPTFVVDTPRFTRTTIELALHVASSTRALTPQNLERPVTHGRPGWHADLGLFWCS